MSQLVLGLGHKARHGKDGFARAIENYYGVLNAAILKHSVSRPVIVQRTAFATALRKEANAWLVTPSGQEWIRQPEYGSYRVLGDPAFPLGRTIPDWVVPDPNPEISEQTPLGKHPKLLQWWGTEYRRTQDPAYWVKQWKASINPQANIVLVTDMRFLNEAAAVKEQPDGYTVNLVRLNQSGTPYVDPSRPSNHPSEIELDGYNYDYAIQSKDAVLAGEFAITLVHFLRARAMKGK